MVNLHFLAELLEVKLLAFDNGPRVLVVHLDQLSHLAFELVNRLLKNGNIVRPNQSENV